MISQPKSFDGLKNDKRGQMALMFALSMIPLFGLAALSIDLTRAFVAKTHLQASVDAAALAASSAYGKPESEVHAVGMAFFNKNYASRDWVPATTPTITVTDNVLRVEATATLKTSLLSLFGFSSLPLSVSTETITEPTGIEVALVVDVTHSMSGSAGAGTRIESLRAAAADLVGILFDSAPNPNLVRIAVIPYNGTVNIGPSMTAYVDGEDAANFPGTSWAGCVMARKNGYDVLDEYQASATNIGRGRWSAYRWPAEPNQTTASGAEHIGCVNPAGLSPVAPYKSVVDVFNPTVDYPTESYGPNRSCPQPLLPLSSDRTLVESEIASLDVYSRSATMTGLGAAWGWRVLSPDEPFSNGASYSDLRWQKFLIIMTDGRQNLSSQQSDTGGSCSAAGYRNGSAWSFDPANHGSWGSVLTTGPIEQWTAYGYPISSGSLGGLTSYDGVVGEIESSLTQVCNNIKDVIRPNDQPAFGIYSITFGDGISESQLADVKGCASTPSNYFHAPTGLSLEAVFSEIAYDILSTRITQ